MNKISKVFKIGISKNNSQKINEVSEIEVLAGKGILGDRHFHVSTTEHHDHRQLVAPPSHEHEWEIFPYAELLDCVLFCQLGTGYG